MQLKNLSHRTALKFKNRQEWIRIETIASIFVVTVKFVVKKIKPSHFSQLNFFFPHLKTCSSDLSENCLFLTWTLSTYHRQQMLVDHPESLFLAPTVPEKAALNAPCSMTRLASYWSGVSLNWLFMSIFTVKLNPRKTNQPNINKNLK